MGWPAYLLNAAGLRIFKGGDVHDADTGYRVNGLAASGKVLRGDGTNFISANPRNEDLTTAYRFRANATGIQNLAIGTSGTFVVVKLDNKAGVSYDPNSNFDAVTNYTYTVPVTGYYQINAAVVASIALGAVGTILLLSLFDNGAEIFRGQWTTIEVGVNTFIFGLGLATQELLTAGHTIDIRFFQNSGAAQSIGAAATSIYNIFSAHLLST